jgi:hypothetical protein
MFKKIIQIIIHFHLHLLQIEVKNQDLYHVLNQIKDLIVNQNYQLVNKKKIKMINLVNQNHRKENQIQKI